MADTTIIPGRSNNKLAQSLSKELDAPLVAIELSEFINGETRVWVKDEEVMGHAVVVQSFSRPVDRNIIEFALMCDAVHRMGATDIHAVIPWLGYSKQDKVFRQGEPLSVKVIAKMIQVVPIRRLYTFDLHNLAVLGFFEIPVVNLSARPLFERHFRDRKNGSTMVVAPDAGAVKSSTSFAQALDVPVVYMDKKRDLATGKVTVLGMSRSVEDSDIIIIDDMIVTGSTIAETARYLKDAGARRISVAATHHLYVKGADEQMRAGGVDEIVVTDTVYPEHGKPDTRLTILSVSSLLGAELRKLR